MSNVPHLRFPEFDGEWEESTIGEQFDLYSGNTPSRLNKEHFNGSINWISSGELKEHYIKDSKEKISEEAAKNLKMLPKGTFVIAIYGLEAEGVRGTGSILLNNATISQACMAFSHKAEITNEFLYSWYKKHGNVIGIRYAQGTKQQNLSYDILEKFKISYPAIQEQEKLNRFISLLDKRITTQNKIIEKLESLIKGIIYQTKSIGLAHNTWQKTELRKVLQERNEKNVNGYDVCSVSVTQGVVNQIEYLGRSFAAKDTQHYNVVKYGDIVYTKSPTGDFPYGIVKRSNVKCDVAVSPLYGVYKPVNDYVGIILHFYFMQPSNTLNYLHPLIQKGAKNTINITNGRFLENTIPLPKKEDETKRLALTLTTIQSKIILEQDLLQSYLKQKQYLLRHMFI
ncbi:restriction endonuclease subunit S [Bacteroides xylanisolvens]|uniref:restriction endonuclease subunit S n=1 Tax=Bacteroides xylanisolvens TaxID=371601 RepID=UPI00397C4F5F